MSHLVCSLNNYILSKKLNLVHGAAAMSKTLENSVNEVNEILEELRYILEDESDDN